MKFLVIYEKAPGNYCAFVPNLPVICLSTGATVEEIQQNIREAMDGHLEFMQMDGDPIIQPSVWFEELEVGLSEDGQTLKYNVMFENSPTNNAAYCTDLPGCWATGSTLDEARDEMRRVIHYRLDDSATDDENMPGSDSWAELVEVALPVPAEGIPATGP